MENNMEKIFEKIENKYGQKYEISYYTSGWDKKYIRIKSNYFEIFIPKIYKKSDIVINTFDNIYYYNVIESIVNSVNRMIKKYLSNKND